MRYSLFKGYLLSGDKHYVRYMHQQKDKYDYGQNIEKDNLITLVFNNYDNICKKYKCIANFLEEDQIVALSSELNKIKDINLDPTKVFNTKGCSKGYQTKQTNPKVSNKKSPMQKNDYKYACKKVPINQGNK